MCVLKKLGLVMKYKKRINFSDIRCEKNVSLKIINNGRITAENNLRIRSNSNIVAAGGIINIGENVFINRNCNIVSRESIVIEDAVSVGPNVTVIDHDHLYDSKKVYDTQYKTGRIIIEKGCWLGAGVIVLRNTRIGEGSVIGAGCVVKGDIPPHSRVTMNRELMIEPIR